MIDDESNMRHMLAAMLKNSGYSVDTASEGLEGMKMLERSSYDFILCDIKMPKMDGMTFLKTAGDLVKHSTVIMMSAYGTVETAIEAMKLGAYDYISKPFKSDEVTLTLKKAEERERLKKENNFLRERIRTIQADNRFDRMVGQSKAIQAVFELAKKVARHNTTVLITGESGTGKELIARGIHFYSERADGRLIPVNCGGIPENLLESEMFGYKKGAFTGADRDKAGLFEAAGGGTLFLDEIGELPLSLQVKLLRVLQESEIRPVGDPKTHKVDVRVITATAKNLEAEMRKGTFREDLFYRLNVMQIHLPPLRERTEDIPPLCQLFIERFNGELKKNIASISPGAMSHLMKHPWPGNVRELENVIQRAVVLAEQDALLPEHLPGSVVTGLENGHLDTLFEGFSLKEAQRSLEKKLIVKALTETGGNRTRAARLLEISHPSLLSKIKAYGIDL
ncbi:MAG: sigma-54 dependent transcriptional regulator [Desulfobacterales bacterium]|nr:sigma-54 dependent transcriptional regulator [Desulfobacterales bacterium]